MASTSTMSRVRQWNGPAIFSYGFRPFFLFGAIHAAFMVALWVPWFLGFISLPSSFAPVVWHEHELLFGYVPAVVAGFLLTAVPNWTGRLPVTGWPLATLFLVWLAGRISVAVSAWLPYLAVTVISLAFPLALFALIGREILSGKNWRNAKVLFVVALLTLSQLLFHYEAGRFGRPVISDRLAIAATIMLIMIIGGRIVPSFTTNWLKKANPGLLPAPFSRFDRIAMIAGAVALAAWVWNPAHAGAGFIVGILLTAAGILQVLRITRWHPLRTFAEPLVTILHAGFAFVPLGFLFASLAAFTNISGAQTAAIHAWTVGAIGTMTLAVMTRASRGHTGQSLTAPPATVAIYTAIIVAAAARIAAAFLPTWTMLLMPIAGLAWIAAYLGFALAYAPLLLSKRRTTTG